MTNNAKEPEKVVKEGFWDKTKKYAKTVAISGATLLGMSQAQEAKAQESNANQDKQDHKIEVAAPEQQEAAKDTISFEEAQEQYAPKQYERISEKENDLNVRRNSSIKSETTHTYDEYGYSKDMFNNPNDHSNLSIVESKRTDTNRKDGSWKSVEEHTFIQDGDNKVNEFHEKGKVRKNGTAVKAEYHEKEVTMSEGNKFFSEASYSISEKHSMTKDRKDGTSKVIENSSSVEHSHGNRDFSIYEKIHTYRGTNNPKKAHIIETVDGITTEKKVKYDKDGNASEKIIREEASQAAEKPPIQKIGQEAKHDIDLTPAQVHFRQSRQDAGRD